MTVCPVKLQATAPPTSTLTFVARWSVACLAPRSGHVLACWTWGEPCTDILIHVSDTWQLYSNRPRVVCPRPCPNRPRVISTWRLTPSTPPSTLVNCWCSAANLNIWRLARLVKLEVWSPAPAVRPAAGTAAPLATVTCNTRPTCTRSLETRSTSLLVKIWWPKISTTEYTALVRVASFTSQLALVWDTETRKDKRNQNLWWITFCFSKQTEKFCELFWETPIVVLKFTCYEEKIPIFNLP